MKLTIRRLIFPDDYALGSNSGGKVKNRPGYSFSSWSVTTGLTGLGGTPVDTSAASTTVVVAGNSKIIANFVPTGEAPAVIGLRNTIRITSSNVNVVNSKPCAPSSAGTLNCFSIQQNFWVVNKHDPKCQTTTCYWAQNVVELVETATAWQARQRAFLDRN